MQKHTERKMQIFYLPSYMLCWRVRMSRNLHFCRRKKTTKTAATFARSSSIIFSFLLWIPRVWMQQWSIENFAEQRKNSNRKAELIGHLIVPRQRTANCGWLCGDLWFFFNKAGKKLHHDSFDQSKKNLSLLSPAKFARNSEKFSGPTELEFFELPQLLYFSPSP